MLDIDEDGYLDATDLLWVQDRVMLSSEFGEEILNLIEYFIKSQLLVKYANFKDRIDLFKFR